MPERPATPALRRERAGSRRRARTDQHHSGRHQGAGLEAIHERDVDRVLDRGAGARAGLLAGALGHHHGRAHALLGGVQRRRRQRRASELVGELGAVHRREQAADHGDPERSAELTRRVVDRRADAGLVDGQRAHDRLGGRGVDQPETAAHEQHRHDELPVRGVDARREPAITNPTAIATSPPATTTLVPHRPASLADSGAAAPVNTANGTVRTPARACRSRARTGSTGSP